MCLSLRNLVSSAAVRNRSCSQIKARSRNINRQTEHGPLPHQLVTSKCKVPAGGQKVVIHGKDKHIKWPALFVRQVIRRTRSPNLTNPSPPHGELV